MALTREAVVRIDGYLREGTKTHKEIAAGESTTTKTIGRIANGLTWHEVTGRPRKEVPRDPKSIVPLADLKAEVDTLLRHIKRRRKNCDVELAEFKKTWGFSAKRPLMWAEYETWDTFETVATDGVIAWTIDALAYLAKELGALGLGKELPTFGVSHVMTWPIGAPVRVVAIREKGVVLERGVGLHTRFVELAAKHRLDIRWAANQRGIVYLTRAKSKRTVETNSVVVACVATMELPMSDNIEELEIETEELEVEHKTVEINGRSLLPRSEKKISVILKLMRGAKTCAQQEAMVVAFIDAMRKRNYAIDLTGIELVADLKENGVPLMEAVEDAVTILADSGLDVIFTDVAHVAYAEGCWPYPRKPDYFLFQINDEG